MSFENILKGNKVVPVAVVSSEKEAVDLTRSLVAGGISVIEITLRTAAGLAAIKTVKQEVPEAVVLAGTVNTEGQMEAVADAGADGAVSPAFSSLLVSKSTELGLPYLPGVATPSEVLAGMERGLNEFKLFPAAAVGGLALLKSLSSPLAEARFCPTGGLNLDNFNDYLALKNVMCVGGSWMLPSELIASKKWSQLSSIAQNTVDNIK